MGRKREKEKGLVGKFIHASITGSNLMEWNMLLHKEKAVI
jgi:hypothetical protein